MNSFKKLSVLLMVAALFWACDKGKLEDLKREELFTITLGKMENQIDLFMIPGVPFNRMNQIYRKGGRIYIANGNSSKIMEFTSYGDLVFLLHNSESNPEPIMLNNEGKEEDLTNRNAQSFPFFNIGHICVDSEKNLYVEDNVPPEQREVDEEEGAVFYKRIFRFDRQGKLIDFLGQEGVGGTPFPFIDSLYITESDDLVVITRVVSKWIIFWFDREGFLIYQVNIDPTQLPPLKKYLPSLTKILPDYKKRDLLIMITYYEEEINEATQTRETISNALDRIYRFNLAEERYTGYLDMPVPGKKKISRGAMELEIAAQSYELLGVVVTGEYFLIRPVEFNQYELLVLGSKGNILVRSFLNIEDSEIFFKTLNLSEKGILTALLCFRDNVKIVSWRSDKLIEDRVD